VIPELTTPEVLTIIPARLGSKRAPKKNIKTVAGKPLIHYTIKAALEAELVSRVIVSTESQEIAKIAYDCGAEIPFLRPPDLSEDYVDLADVCLHAVRWLAEREDYHPKYVIKLNPTAPLRTSEDIDAVVHMAIDKNADAVIHVCPVEGRNSWSEIVLDGDGRAIEWYRRDALGRGECRPLYTPFGGTCLIRPEILEKTRTMYPSGFYAYIIPVERSLDIDLPWHLYLADLILNDIQ